MNIGKNIKELRTRKGLTQKDLAEKLNVTPQAVSHWELDSVEPSLSTIKDMAELFGVTTDQLMSDNLDISKAHVVEATPVNIIIDPDVDGDENEEKSHEDEPKKETLPVIGVCKHCGKEIHPGEGRQVKTRGGLYYECNTCMNSIQIQKEADQKEACRKMRIKAWIVSPIIGVVAMGLIIALGVWLYGNEYLGQTIGIGIGIGVLSFTTLFCIMMHNNFVGDMWLDVATWGCVRLPGIIFTLDFDGIVFLIITKILCFILSAILVLGALTLATGLAFICSIFVFPFSVYWAYKRPEKSERI